MKVYVVVLMPLIALIGVGSYMVYSALSGKGVPQPDKDALFQTKFGYKLRGLIGLFIILVCCFAIWNILNL